MRIGFLKNKEREGKIYLALDIGTEAVKALIFRVLAASQNINKKISVLGWGVQYFDRSGFFSGPSLEKEAAKKTILKAIGKARENLFLSPAEKDLKEKVQKQKKWQVFLGLSPDKLKARAVSQYFIRKNSKARISRIEETNIKEEIFNGSRRAIAQTFLQKFGILPNDIYWLFLRILEMRVDGHPVQNLQGHKGKNVEFKVLAGFAPKRYLKNIKEIIKSLGLEILKISHIAEALPNLLAGKKKNGIFIDVGGEISQFILVEQGALKQIEEFESGGKAFTEILSETLGQDQNAVRFLKEDYSQGRLSIGSVKKIKEFLRKEKINWYQKFKDNIKKSEGREALLPNIYLFGGGSLTPDIKEILEEKIEDDKNNLHPSYHSEVKFIYPRDFKNIEGLGVSSKNPQIIPSLLICQYAKEIF